MSQEKILVVEDEDYLRKAFVELLQLEDFVVLQASSGKEALIIVDRDPHIAFVISDVRMPNGDGIYLLDELRRRHPEIPIVLLLSGYTEYSEEKVKDRGAIGMLSKPINFNELSRYLHLCPALFSS